MTTTTKPNLFALKDYQELLNRINHLQAVSHNGGGKVI